MNIIPAWPAPANVCSLISTRRRGHSLSPYKSNNLGLHVGDNGVTVELNRRELCAGLALDKTPQWLNQIHGVKVVRAKADGLVRTADGSYSSEPGQACAVMTADCLPLLLCDGAVTGQATQVAAVHCGWRSLVKGITARARDKFTGDPQNLMAYLGPAISQTHFEVGIDVLDAFFKSSRNLQHTDAIAAAFIPAQRPLHFYANIYALAHAELTALGITNIHGGDYCTYADQARFYSFRRDGITGRMASLIWLHEPGKN